MKRFALYSLTLLAVISALALAVDYANVWLICSSSGNSAYKMKRLYENPMSDEIAIVGSSRAAGNFVPSVLSPRCFDYGIHGAAMQEIVSMLEVLQKRKTTAPVILNLDPWGGFKSTKTMADYRLAPQSGRLSFCDCVPGIRFFGMLRKNLVSFINQRKSVSDIIDFGAVLIKTSRTKAEWQAINAKIKSYGFRGSAANEAHFLSVLHSFAPRQIYVVICPCSSRWAEFFTGMQELAELKQRLSEISNVTLLDYYGAPEFTDADFTDPTHFNLSGARKFSQMLKSQLTSLTK